MAYIDVGTRGKVLRTSKSLYVLLQTRPTAASLTSCVQTMDRLLNCNDQEQAFCQAMASYWYSLGGETVFVQRQKAQRFRAFVMVRLLVQRQARLERICAMNMPTDSLIELVRANWATLVALESSVNLSTWAKAGMASAIRLREWVSHTTERAEDVRQLVTGIPHVAARLTKTKLRVPESTDVCVAVSSLKNLTSLHIATEARSLDATCLRACSRSLTELSITGYFPQSPQEMLNALIESPLTHLKSFRLANTMLALGKASMASTMAFARFILAHQRTLVNVWVSKLHLIDKVGVEAFLQATKDVPARLKLHGMFGSTAEASDGRVMNECVEYKLLARHPLAAVMMRHVRWTAQSPEDVTHGWCVNVRVEHQPLDVIGLAQQARCLSVRLGIGHIETLLAGPTNSTTTQLELCLDNKGRDERPPRYVLTAGWLHALCARLPRLKVLLVTRMSWISGSIQLARADVQAMLDHPDLRIIRCGKIGFDLAPDLSCPVFVNLVQNCKTKTARCHFNFLANAKIVADTLRNDRNNTRLYFSNGTFVVNIRSRQVP